MGVCRRSLSEEAALIVKWDVEVRAVSFEDLAPLAKEAKRERLSFKPTLDTQWFGAYIGNELVGCAAAIWTTKEHKRLRFKSWLVLPEWRGTGAGRALNEERLRWAAEQDCKEIEVITRHPRIYRSLGFQPMAGKKSSWWERVDN